MDDQILTLEKRNKVILKAASDRLEPMKKNLDQIKNDIEAKKMGQNCELFISMKRGKEKMRTFDDQFNKMKEDLTIQHYTLLPSEQTQAMMRNITEICQLSTARITTEISRTPTAILESVIDIKTSKDKTDPNIFGLTIMHGHYCVVADNENNTIKVVDTKSKQVTSEMGIEATYIWGVTSVSDDQVVVSVILSDGKKQIQFFSVSTSGVIQSTSQLYYVDDYYIGMVYCKGYIYGVRVFKIDILSATGKIIKTIKSDDKDDKLFDDLDKIAVSPNGQTLYVTDSDKNSVTSMTLDGNVKAVYTDEDIKEPRGITVDKYGYVYVCSRGTKNIQLFIADLNKVQVLIDTADVINITYSSTESKLYTDENNKINEYFLKFK